MSLQTDDDGEDSDYSFLDDVLSRLYDFGDGPKEKREKKSLKSKRKKAKEEVEDPSADSGVRECANVIGQSIPESAPVPESCQAENTVSAVKRPPEVEIVTFQSHSKKKKAKTAQSLEVKSPPAEERKNIDQKDDPKASRLSLEKARLEVHRFGLTGYQKGQQRVFEQERAIMLGAKPPKREYTNYKVYQQMIKEKKQKAKEEPNLDKKKKKRENKERGEKRKPSSSAIPTGQMGRFKNGVLVLNSKEIQRIKSSKVKK